MTALTRIAHKFSRIDRQSEPVQLRPHRAPVIAAILWAICFPMPGVSAADDSAIIDGPHHSFIIGTPLGWRATSTTELPTAFHPAGTTFDKSPVVMYVRSADKAALHVKTIDELNRLDLRGIQDQHPKAESRKAGSVRISDGTEVPIYSFTGGGYFELVAYAEQPKTITVFVLSSETGKDFTASEKAFYALVASYSFISEDVRAPK